MIYSAIIVELPGFPKDVARASLLEGKSLQFARETVVTCQL